MPCLLIKDNKLVKTTRFKSPAYVGDPVNAIKIFNEKEVDELIVVDISEDRQSRGPNYDLIRQIANECFMPVCYGGGISHVDHVREIFRLGIEKVALNSILCKDADILKEVSSKFGSQSIVAAVDVRKDLFGTYRPCFASGKKTGHLSLTDLLAEIELKGAGEILVNNISRDGTWQGFDLDLLRIVTQHVNVPVIAMGGAGDIGHIEAAIRMGGVSAVAIGSMAVYQSRGMGVLINFPHKEALERIDSIMSENNNVHAYTSIS